MLAPDIQRLLLTLGLNSLQLAEKIGVSHQLMVQWEAGERFATRKHCELMAALLAAKENPSSSSAD